MTVELEGVAGDARGSAWMPRAGGRPALKAGATLSGGDLRRAALEQRATLSPQETGLHWLLTAAIALPGLAALLSLALSVAYSPGAIARGEHLGPLGAVAAPCPGCAMCGMSRAFSALSHGNLTDAIAFNPGVIVLWPGFIVLAIVSCWAVIRLQAAPLYYFPSKEDPSHADLRQ